MKLPTLLIVYKRPDTVRQVLRAIRQARPPRLYIAADGPRSEDERKDCILARKAASDMDWPCEVKTLFRRDNLGCRRAVSEAIDWFFSHEPEGVILEDDCVPSQSFFYYCEELLERYRNNERVMVIAGSNFQWGRRVTRASYYFSRYNHCWGWASWRRAWQHYDREMEAWPGLKRTGWMRELSAGNRHFERYWTHIFDEMLARRIDTWDFVWTFSCWARGGLAALPVVNLVRNIGFGPGATHSKDPHTPLRHLAACELRRPLRHPEEVVRNEKADAFFDIGSLPVRAARYFERLLRRSLGMHLREP